MDIYIQHFKGKILYIGSDCSYAGSWVQQCAQFLEEQEVTPCAHSAREKGVLLVVVASCRSSEIPFQLYSAVRHYGNDKNTGALCCWLNGWKVAEGQHVKAISSLKIECENKSIDDPCLLRPGITWTRKVQKDRIFLVRGCDRERPAWHYVLLVDDEDTIREFTELTQGENSGMHTLNMNDYGQVIKSGFGRDPPNEVKDWMEQHYDAS